MTDFNQTLARQLRRLKLSEDAPPSRETWQKFLRQLDSHYQHVDDDRNMLSRSLELTTDEMTRVQESVQLERDHLRNTMAAVQSAVTDFAEACQHARNSGGEDRSQITGARRAFNFAIARLLDEFKNGSAESRELLNSLRTSFVELFEEVISLADPSMATTKEVVDMHQSLIEGDFEGMIDGVEVATVCEQLQGVGGDIWKWTVLPSGQHLVCIGDATGHGPNAGFLVAVIATALDGWLANRESVDLTALATYLDELVFDLGRQKMLLTFCALAIDPSRKSARVLNAGHSFPIVLRDDRSKALVAKGNPLGTMTASTTRVGRLALEPGDRVVLITDGLTEIQNPVGVEFGERRLRRVIERFSDRQPRDLITGMLEEVDAYREGEPMTDDRTITVVAVT